MNSFLKSQVRPEILQMNAYQSARSLVSQAEPSYTYLDANELPDSEERIWNRYPDSQPVDLISRFSEIYNVPKSSIIVSRGSDEAIDLLIRAFCKSGEDTILTFPPTYGMYQVSAEIQGTRIAKISLKENGGTWALDFAAIEKLVKKETNKLKLIFLCNPNNPTGHLTAKSDVVKLLELAGNSIIVVDEAYIEFQNDRSVVDLLRKYDRLVVLRTLSKAWGLAGLRVGAALANHDIVQILKKILAPYPIPQPVIEVALRNLDRNRWASLAAETSAILIRQKKFGGFLRTLSLVEEVYPSTCNFILFKSRWAHEIVVRARAAGIIIRLRSRDQELGDSVRCTIGSEDEVRRLKEFFQQMDFSFRKEQLQNEKIFIR